MKFLSVLSTILACASAVCAEEYPRNFLSLSAENDVGFSDRYYTNGLKIQYTNEGCDFWTNRLQFALLDLLPISGEHKKRFQTLALGQNINVPQDINMSVPPADDRPYAGWLYLNAASHLADENSMDTFAATFGIVGRHSYAGDIQRWWHKAFDFDTPMGWDHEIADEFGFVFSYNHAERVWRADLGGGCAADAVASAGADLGNVICRANLALLLRAGYALPWTFAANKFEYASNSDVEAKFEDSFFSLYFQAGAAARFVGYDISLNGNAFADCDVGVSPEWFVCEPVAGVSARLGRAQIDLCVNYRTREFRTQRIGHHTFWSLTLKYMF